MLTEAHLLRYRCPAANNPLKDTKNKTARQNDIDNHNLCRALLAAQKLTRTSLQRTYDQAAAQQQSLIDFIIEEQILSAETIAQVSSQFYNIPLVTAQSFSSPSPIKQYKTLLLIALKHIPHLLSTHNNTLFFSDPEALKHLNTVSFSQHKNITPVITNHITLLQSLTQLKRQQQQQQQQQKLSIHATKPQHSTNQININVLADQIIEDAIHKNASDIHIEPSAFQSQVRVRVDGILQPLTQFSSYRHHTFTNHIKVLAQLDITEQRLPQDGQFIFRSHNAWQRHCRISFCPTQFGEKLVIRILNPKQHLMDLNKLGMTNEQQRLFRHALQQPQGLILLSGPTGSGKSMTLYTALSMLNDGTRNISTIEDPIEIQLPGINQTNIQPNIQLDFKHILRALLRQDPDVIMIGEIRDAETAQIAFQAAQTGHLVLASVHANNANATVQRLQQLGLSPLKLKQINLIVAQRLLRKSHHPNPSSNTYSGRIGIFEMKTINNASLFQTLQQRAAQLIKENITTHDEVARVLGNAMKDNQ